MESCCKQGKQQEGYKKSVKFHSHHFLRFFDISLHDETDKETKHQLKKMKKFFLIMKKYWKNSFYRIFSFVYNILRPTYY